MTPVAKAAPPADAARPPAEAGPPEPRQPEVLTGEVLPAHSTTVAPVVEPAARNVPGLRDFRNRPTQTAELLALVAVAHYGPAAARNVNALREAYPSAAPEGIARVAAHQFVRQARNRGALAGLAGPVAVLLDVSALHALHAELILNIAAAHGLDPTAPERAAELLFLQGVHDTAAEATTAVRSAIEPRARGNGDRGAGDPGDGDPTRLSRPLARSLTIGMLRMGARRVMRLIPGAGAIIGAMANARATDDMANRALRFYRARR